MGFWTDYCGMSLDTALPPDCLLCDILCVSFSLLLSNNILIYRFQQMVPYELGPSGATDNWCVQRRKQD